ncbi:anthranilate synthase [Pseudoscourfieldia marina]
MKKKSDVFHSHSHSHSCHRRHSSSLRHVVPVRASSSSSSSSASSTSSTIADSSSAPRVILIDNYDSFTYNIVQYLGDLGCLVDVIENDKISVPEVAARKPDGVVVSPGPGRPEDSGISLEVAEMLTAKHGIPVFGVCMGHQCIGQAFGGNVVRTPTGLVHGKSSPVFHDGEGLFEDMDNPFDAARYHSLCIEKESMPDCLTITAWTEDGSIMGVKHNELDIVGVQFHPESIITKNGLRMVENWIRRVKEVKQERKQE